MRIAQLSVAVFAVLAHAANPALATQAAIPKIALTLQRFHACEVTAAALHTPIGLLRFFAADPAVGFASTTEARLSLTDKPVLAAHLVRKAADGAWRLWLLSEGMDSNVFIPFDAELRFHTPEGQERIIAHIHPEKLQIFSIDIAELLADFPGQERMDYVITAKRADETGHVRVYTQGSIDLERLRLLKETVSDLFDGVETGRLTCETPASLLPHQLNPSSYRECVLDHYPHRRTSGSVHDDFVRIEWRYDLQHHQRPQARIKIELAGPAIRIAPLVPNSPIGQTDPLELQWHVTITGLGGLRSDASVDASAQPVLRIDGDWGSREMPLREAARPWPSDLTAQMTATRSAVRLTVLAQDGSKLQSLTVPVGSFRNAKRDIRKAALELALQVADPMTYCDPPSRIVLFHERIQRQLPSM